MPNNQLTILTSPSVSNIQPQPFSMDQDNFNYVVTPPSLRRNQGSQQLQGDFGLTQEQLLQLWQQQQEDNESISTTPTSVTSIQHNAYVAAALQAQQNNVNMDLLEPADPSWTMPGNVSYISHDLSGIFGNLGQNIQRSASVSSNQDGRDTPTEDDVKPSKSSQHTFVHKLHAMVNDKMYQSLISWNLTGTGFVVCNVAQFSKDVLPKHFKHNNFSSFVRQLNMYGFHKINKSPRGTKTLAENQIWEFSHPKFHRDRPDALDEIKRKSMETETMRRDTVDTQLYIHLLQTQLQELASQHQETKRQNMILEHHLNTVVNELQDVRRRQDIQQGLMKSLMDYCKSNFAQNEKGGEHRHNFETYENMSKNSSMAPTNAPVVSPTTSNAAQILAQTQMIASAASDKQAPNLSRTQSLPTGQISSHFSAYQIANAMTSSLPPSPGIAAQMSRSPEPPSTGLYTSRSFLEDGISGLSTHDEETDL